MKVLGPIVALVMLFALAFLIGALIGVGVEGYQWITNTLH